MRVRFRRQFIGAILFAASATLGCIAPSTSVAQPRRLELTDGVIEPLPFALPTCISETSNAGEMAQQISGLVADDLRGTGLFRHIQPEAFISQISAFGAPRHYPDWRALESQPVRTCAVSGSGDGPVPR